MVGLGGVAVSKIDVKGLFKKVKTIYDIKITGFRKLTRHFNDHGNEFGSRTEDEYFQKAKTFLGGKPQEGVREKINKYGDSILRYDEITNTFGSVNLDTGEIRTFFKPDINIHNYKTNLAYFNAQ